MEFDKGLELAVTLGWHDLATDHQFLSARVEYESREGMPVDLLTVWAHTPGGHQHQVCDWTSASPAHTTGVRFSNNYHSDTLAKALDFIMKNQDQFTRPTDAWRPHLILIQPPGADLVAQASAWMRDIQTEAKRVGGTVAKAGWRPVRRQDSNDSASDPRTTPLFEISPA